MAEPFALATGIVTLADCIVKITKLVSTYRGAEEQLGKYRTSLQHVQQSFDIVNRLEKDPGSAKACSVHIDGEDVSVVEICSKSIDTLTNDANKYLGRLEKAQDPGVLQQVKRYMRNIVGKTRYLIDEPHIKSLIDAAKQVEASLHIALSAMTFAKIEADAQNWQNEFNKLNEEFRNLSEKIGKPDAPVLEVVKRGSIRQKNNSIRNSLNRGKETLLRRQRDNFGKRTSSEVLTTESVLSLSTSNCDTTSTEYTFVLRNEGPLSSPDADIPLDEPTTTDCQRFSFQQGHEPLVQHAHKSSTEQVHESSVHEDHKSSVQHDHESSVQHDHESSVQHDHESSVQHDHESSVQHDHESSVQHDHESSVQHDHESSVQRDSESLIQQEHESLIHPDHESTNQQDDESSIKQDDESSVHQDQEETSDSPNLSENDCSSEFLDSPYSPPSTTIQAKGTIFIDITVNIADCLSSETGLLHFCIRMLTIYDDTGTHAVLKEPCNPNSKNCSHIRVSIRSRSAFKDPLPYSVAVKWRHGPTLVADATFDQHIEPENLVLQLSDSCDDPESHTQIQIHSKRRIMHYAACCELSARLVTNEGESSNTAHNADNDAEAGVRNPTVDSEAQTMPQASEEDKTAHDMGPFTRVPCIFCRADAEEPLLDANGVVGALIYQNRSLGYTCKRCRKRSWVSGGEFGLSLPGASWSWIS